MDTIVVTGTEAGIAAERIEIGLTPGGATLIDMEDAGERYVGNLSDALRYAPGVWSASDSGSDGIFFSSRGSNLDATDWDMNGIKLLQDGLPVTAADGNNHNRIIDPLAARYATVARGANAMRYGASTLGGAVNFVTPTARDNPGAELAMTGGSFGQASGRLSFGHVFGESVDALVTVEGRQWDGFRDHSEQRRAGLYGNLGWQIGDALATRFYMTAIENDQELPGSLTREQLEADPSQASQPAVDGNYQLDVDTERLANRTTWQIDANRRLDFGFSVERQQLYHPIVWVAVDFDGAGPAPETELFSLLIDTDHRDLGTMVRYTHTAGDHEVSFGLNYGENDVDGSHHRNLVGRPNGLSTLIDNSARTAELFAMDRWRVTDATTLILAVQGVSGEREVRNLSVAMSALSNPKDSYDGINPRVGVVQSIGDGASFYANLSRLFEPPTNFELEDNVVPGATLKPMEGSVAEIGTRGDRGIGGSRLGWEVSLYYAEIDDEILSVEDPSAPGTSLVTNVDRTVHAGVEALVDATVPLGGGFTFEPVVTLTVNDFRFDDDPVYGGNTLPAAPGYFVRGELIFRGPGGFFAGPTFDRVGKRWADFANTYRVEPHTLVGFRAGWGNERWRAFAHLLNLTDENYVASHSVRNVATPDDAILSPGEPRSAYVGLEMRFE